jgi:RNA polymerase sigma factor (sigma-70 family)
MQAKDEKDKIDKEKSYDLKLKLISSPLLRYTRSRIFNRSDASDVTQEVMLILSLKRDSFDSNKSFYGWAFRICHFQILKYLTDKKRSKEVGMAASEDSLLASLNHFDAKCPLDYALSREILDERNAMLNRFSKYLNPKQKALFNHSLEGKSNKEIMEIMGINPRDFYSTKGRTIKKLKSLIKKSWRKDFRDK